MPYWIEFFKKIPTTLDVIEYPTNMEIQKGEQLDFILISQGLPALRVDVKVRDWSYHKLYEKDNCILVETDGNTTGSEGSSVFNSNADLWGYAFFDGLQLYDILVYYREPFAEWFKHTQWAFESPRNANTDGYYETKNRLVKRIFFSPYLWRHEN